MAVELFAIAETPAKLAMNIALLVCGMSIAFKVLNKRKTTL